MWCVNAGMSRDHMKGFKRHRDAYLSDTVVETNRLVVRLEKVTLHVSTMCLGIGSHCVTCALPSAVPEAQR